MKRWRKENEDEVGGRERSERVSVDGSEGMRENGVGGGRGDEETDKYRKKIMGERQRDTRRQTKGSEREVKREGEEKWKRGKL